MSTELLYPYAYCDDLKDYLAPDDLRVIPKHPYKVGTKDVFLRAPLKKRKHFWDPTSKGGVGGGGGGGGPETPAHIFAKKFYKERMFFSARIAGQPILIRFETCELEQRLEERTPDLSAVVSECWPPFIKPGERFILEIHAKNGIHQNPGRRSALEAIGVPCIEVHLSKEAVEWKFRSNIDAAAERRRFENYMKTMLGTPFNCNWIVPNRTPTFTESPTTISLVQPVART